MTVYHVTCFVPNVDFETFIKARIEFLAQMELQAGHKNTLVHLRILFQL
jgi:hypothetical protein